MIAKGTIENLTSTGNFKNNNKVNKKEMKRIKLNNNEKL